MPEQINSEQINSSQINSSPSADHIINPASIVLSLSISQPVLTQVNFIQPENMTINMTISTVDLTQHRASDLDREYDYSYKKSKKLQYVIHQLISSYFLDNHPNAFNMFRAFAEYLDDNSYDKAMKMTDNNSYDTMYEELIDEFYDMYFYDVIDSSKYSLTNENKRLFISIAKMIHNLKGHRKSFEFLFQYLEEFVIEDANDNQYPVDKFTFDLVEDESYWDDATYKPFTYNIFIDQPRDAIREMVESVHPAGFQFEFITRLDFTDEGDESITMTDELHLVVKSQPIYDGTHKYDGDINFGENAIIIDETF